MKIYLDTCCYCRPYDDQTVPKINREASAVIAVAGICKVVGVGVVGSIALIDEIGKIRDAKKYSQVRGFYDSVVDEFCLLSESIKTRAREFMKYGLKDYDSYHLSVAESAGAILLLTTDKDFLNAAARINTPVKVINPLYFSLGDLK